MRDRVIRIIACVWIVVIAVSYGLDLHQEEHSVLTTAGVEARSHFEKDLVYRRWAAQHGGVYVPRSERTPPNPYLDHLPERDVTTTAGAQMTLVNPAYMTRQVHELAATQYGVRGHITSLDPLRPENRPDAWETQALQSFEAGAREAMEGAQIDGQPFLRFAQPGDQVAQRLFFLQFAQPGGVRRGNVDRDVVGQRIDLFQTDQVVGQRIFIWRVLVLADVDA